MQAYLDLGFIASLKMKIGGVGAFRQDLRRIDAVLKLLKTPDQLAVGCERQVFNLATALGLRQRPLSLTICAGLRKQVIRWTISCRRPCVKRIARQWPRVRNLFFRTGTPRNLIRYAGPAAGIRERPAV